MTDLPESITRRIGKDLEVRRAIPEDLPAVLRLLSQMHDAPASADTESLQRTFKEILASPSRALLVAIHDAEVLGTLDLFVMANLTRGGRPWAGIENLVVDVDHRREGTASALVQTAVDIASEVGCYKVQLVSHERRGAAHDLYRRAGFEAPVRGYRRYL
jgi:GNAT superfamily N-acetyltransferase